MIYEIVAIGLICSIGGRYVPESCCVGQVNIDMCTGKDNYTEPWPPRVGPPVLHIPANYTLYRVVRMFIFISSTSWLCQDSSVGNNEGYFEGLE